MAKLIFLTGFCFLASNNWVKAQKNIAHTNQQWVHYYQQLTLTPHWSWLFDAGYRAKESFQSANQLLLRTGLSYSMEAGIRTGAGAAYLDYYQSGKIKEQEYRLHQEVQLQRTLLKNWVVDQRFRIEERFFEQNESGSTPRAFSWRWRYKLSCTVPAVHFSACDISLLLAEELFLNSGKEITYNIFDQNRWMAGITLKGKKTLSYTLLYTSQFSSENRPNSYKQTRIIWFTLNNKIALKSKKRNS